MQTPDLSTSPRAVWRLTWPQMLMMYVMFIMTLVPVWTAGRLGADVQAALGMVTQCSLFLTVLSMGLASGATAAVSQAMGALRLRRAGLYIATTLLISVLLGVLMGACGIFFADGILDMVRIPDRVVPVARELLTIFMLGLPFAYVYAATGVIFRSTRQVIPPLVVSAVLAVVHAIFCIGTGLGLGGLPDWGYLGIAWASVAGNVLGSVINCCLLIRAGHLKRATLPRLRWLKKGLPYLVRVAVPAGFASLVWQSGYLVLFILVASVPFESVSALAGLTAGLRIEGFLFMPAMAFNMTASVLVGNCLGACKEDEAKRVSLSLLRTAVVLMSILAVFIWPFREDLAALLSTEPGTRQYIVSYLFYNLISTPFSIASTVLGGVMVGAGATQLNLMVFGGSFWLIRLPLGYVLGHLVWGNASGVFCAMLISQVLQTLAMLAVFFRVRWMDHAMRARSAKKRNGS
ncbi:MAG: MATE family efflux transporter [Desulfovibrionaceae bacterium]|nr:MATE family efflux transporter [Desulfovibrionaceae bacterium]